MKKKYDKEEIENKLVEIVQDIIEDDTITIDLMKSLVLEYELDSIDLLDLTYNIEQIFGVKIGPDELSGGAEEMLPEKDLYEQDGILSEKALEIMKKNIPEIPQAEFSYGLRPEDIPSLLNIKVFSRIIFDKMALAS